MWTPVTYFPLRVVGARARPSRCVTTGPWWCRPGRPRPGSCCPSPPPPPARTSPRISIVRRRLPTTTRRPGPSRSTPRWPRASTRTTITSFPSSTSSRPCTTGGTAGTPRSGATSPEASPCTLGSRRRPGPAPGCRRCTCPGCTTDSLVDSSSSTLSPRSAAVVDGRTTTRSE